MNKVNDDELPKNSIEAQGLLIKSIYNRFGRKSLSIIKDVFRIQGRALGLKVIKKLPDNRLTTVAKAFSKSFDPKYVKIITLSEEKFQIQGTKCPFCLENTSRELCEATMAIDYEYFRTAVDNHIELKIIKTLAAGDPYCDTIYELKK